MYTHLCRLCNFFFLLLCYFVASVMFPLYFVSKLSDFSDMKHVIIPWTPSLHLLLTFSSRVRSLSTLSVCLFEYSALFVLDLHSCVWASPDCHALYELSITSDCSTRTKVTPIFLTNLLSFTLELASSHFFGLLTFKSSCKKSLKRSSGARRKVSVTKNLPVKKKLWNKIVSFVSAILSKRDSTIA